MDLELSDEQVWIEESINTLLDRQWPPAEAAWQAGEAERARLWEQPRRVRRAQRRRDGDLGAIELCLVARALGASPCLGPAARQRRRSLRARAASPRSSPTASPRCWTATPGSRSRCSSRAAAGRRRTRARPWRRTGSPARRPPSSTLPTPTISPSWPASTASPAWPSFASGIARHRAHAGSRASTLTVPLSRVAFADADVEAVVGGRARGGDHRPADQRRGTARRRRGRRRGGRGYSSRRARYASERRQFGRTIASNQALRHLMADLHVRQASGWSTTLFAAAALDDGIPGSAADGVGGEGVRLAGRARGRARLDAGVRRHRVHRGAPRPSVPAAGSSSREQQFGDAAHHERELGRSLAAAAASGTGGGVTAAEELGFNDPTAQRLERITTGADAGDRRADARRHPPRPALARRATSRSSRAASRT